MTSALVAAIKGQKVLLLEKSRQIGGTTAFSSGTTWIPDNPYLRRLGVIDDAGRAMQYLDALVGERADRALRETFVEQAPLMIEFLDQHSEVRFQAYTHHPDYRQDMPGAAAGGRPLEPLPFDGRLLGRHFETLRCPIPELTIFGGMMLTRGEASTLLRGLKSWQAIRLAASLLSRHLVDRIRYARGTRLVLGNALAARLYKSLLEHHVDIRLQARTSRLVLSADRVVGVQAKHQGQTLRLQARLGVVLAGGGFPASRQWLERYLPHPTAPATAACPDSTGETVRLALEAGAALGKGSIDNALWFPSSIAARKDGSIAVYPHIVLDRPKPGLIAVNAAGERFVNEAVSYHEFTRAMYRAHCNAQTIPTLLICDRRFLWNYGLGMVRPQTLSLSSYIKSGYLRTGATLAALAEQIQIDPAKLSATVERHNEFARNGVDIDFHKGETLYERTNGDASHGPNPCLGELRTPPYFAVAVYPTPLGTSLGLRTSPQAEVLDASGCAIPGLYACGNDMDSIFGGEYPGAGAQIGPAMTFGYLAAQHAVGQAS